MVGIPAVVKTDRFRKITASVLFILVAILIIGNLIGSSDNPSSSLSWTIAESQSEGNHSTAAEQSVQHSPRQAALTTDEVLVPGGDPGGC